MDYSVAAQHAKGKVAQDKIFGASAAAAKAVAEYGREKVVNATIGAFMDEQEKLACLPTVEKVYRELPIENIISYAPIAGRSDYLKAAIDLTFGESRPEGYISAVATAGGSGAIHHVIWNYSEMGDTVLTSDWYWGPYKVFCQDTLRKLDTYTMFDENQNFNMRAFSAKIQETMKKQDNVVVIINAPAHNPTGYSLDDKEWDQVLAVLKEAAKDEKKRIVPLIDIAYLEFAGESRECRAFMKKLGNLPANILPILAFSMSKGFTMYGQRTGAMIGVSASKEVITEFDNINQFSSRATWSNINHAAMRTMATIYQDKAILSKVEEERNYFYSLIRKRADIFMQEAQTANLKMLPYRAGFFLSIPTTQPDEACKLLHQENLFAVPLAKGIRIAVCAVPSSKIVGMAEKVAKAVAVVQG
jgi:aromatic-amino-acid transaminase